MTTWKAVRSPAGILGVLGLAGLLGLAVGFGQMAAEAMETGYNLVVFLAGVGATIAAGGALLLAYRLLGYYTLHYTLDRNALTIRRAGLREVIPLARLTIAAVATLPPAEHPPGAGGGLLPGVGHAGADAVGPVLGYATAPPARQLLVRTPTGGYLISPARPDAFLAAVAEQQAQGPSAPTTQGTSGWATHPLLGDRLAHGLLLGGLLLNLALFGYLALMIGSLPTLFALHWNTQGEPDRIGEAAELVRLPAIALGLWVVDVLIAAGVRPRDRLAAILLLAGGAVVQVVFWAAVLTIMLRAVG